MLLVIHKILVRALRVELRLPRSRRGRLPHAIHPDGGANCLIRWLGSHQHTGP